MTINVTLTDLTTLANDSSAVTSINNNSTAITTGFDSALNTAGDLMQGTLDLNSNQIINLPTPATANSPLRLTDLNSFIGGGTISTLPVGGTTGQVLEKNSNTSYDVKWGTVLTAAGGANTDVQFNSSGAFNGDSGFTYAGSGQATLALGTITTSKSALSVTGTWNAAVTYAAPLIINIGNATPGTTSARGSKSFDVQQGGTSIFTVGDGTYYSNVVIHDVENNQSLTLGWFGLTFTDNANFGVANDYVFNQGGGNKLDYNASTANTWTFSAPVSINNTWNSGGTVFDAPILLNVTNTASASLSKLIDLQIGGVSQFAVGIQASGTVQTIWLSGATPSTTNYFVANDAGAALFYNSVSNHQFLINNGSSLFTISPSLISTPLPFASSAAITSNGTAGIGYSIGSGAGGTVIQATNKSTGVTLNKIAGQITMNAASLAAGTVVSFVLTDSVVGATDTFILNHISGGTPGSYTLNAQAAAGSATINVRNNTVGALAEAIVIQYTVIKSVIS